VIVYSGYIHIYIHNWINIILISFKCALGCGGSSVRRMSKCSSNFSGLSTTN
jgi:hypothetical protein